MNENIDLRIILRNCPFGTIFYTELFGYVRYWSMNPHPNVINPILVKTVIGDFFESFTAIGSYSLDSPKCELFPSATQRDWNKFIITWRDKFDPQTLKPVDQVLAKTNDVWYFDFFQKYVQEDVEFPYHCLKTNTNTCIPYNDDTKHLVGTAEEALEYYRYWED